MKKIIIFLAVLVFGYDAKVLPFDEFDVKSAVSGKVVYSNKNLEANNVKNKTVVKLDDISEKIDKQNLQNQIKLLKEEIKNQEELVKRKKDTYLRYKNLKTKSQLDKDMKYYDYLNASNQLINLKSQLDNSTAKLAKIDDILNKKDIKANGYVYKIYVDKGDYVTPGRLVAKVYDINKEKLYIYVPINEIDSVKREVFINGKKSNFKVFKVWNVPDDTYITSYKVELVGKGLKLGEVVKVEFKKE